MRDGSRAGISRLNNAASNANARRSRADRRAVAAVGADRAATVHASPETEGAIVGVMVAAAVGVTIRRRPARWLARAIGYGMGLNAVWLLLELPSSVTDRWRRGMLSVVVDLRR